MNNALSETIDPLQLANKKACLEGSLQLSSLARLRGLIMDTSGEVRYRLRFARNREGLASIKGIIQTQLVLQCQRCLQRMPLSVEILVALGITQTEQDVAELPAAYEPLSIAGGEEYSLAEMVEDELLLALPVVALHERSECHVAETVVVSGASEEPPTQRPFASLASLEV